MTYLTYQDLAELTGMTVGALRMRKVRGQLPEPVKVGSATVWLDTPELRRWIGENSEDTNGHHR